MRIEHSLPPGFLGRRPIRVLVVGAGGTGSAILLGLPYLDQAMRVWGHPYGLQVCMMDGDTVSETNCVRQPFSASDIGQNKATVLINRINLFWGTKWSAEPSFFNERTLRRSHDERSRFTYRLRRYPRRTQAHRPCSNAANAANNLLARYWQQRCERTIHPWTAAELTQSAHCRQAAYRQ